MKKEIKLGKLLLKITIPISWCFSIFLFFGGIASAIRIFFVDNNFIETVHIGLTNIYQTINNLLGILFILIILLVLPIPTTVFRLQTVQKLLTVKSHNYDQIKGISSNQVIIFSKITNNYSFYENPFYVLLSVRNSIYTYSIISLFFLALCFSPFFLSQQIVNNNEILLLTLCLLNIFNPSHILALIAYRLLYGNEIRRRKNKIRIAEQVRISNEQDSFNLIKQCGMAFFVKYYLQLKNMNDIDLIDIISESYPYEVKMERVVAGKQIITKGLDKLVLSKITNCTNEQISEETIANAKSILNKMS